MPVLISLVDLVAWLLTVAVIADVLLSYFLSPYHPVRRALDSIVEPLLTPIRRFMPVIGGFDFSPWVLIILIQVIGDLVVKLLIRVAT